VTDRESSTTGENLNPSQNNRRDNTDNLPNPNDQFLKNIKINVLTFDGHHDPQIFLSWTLQLGK